MSKTETNAPDTGADAAASATPAVKKDDLATAARKSASKGVWMGTAAGIGSAAIVAALLYARRKS